MVASDNENGDQPIVIIIAAVSTVLLLASLGQTSVSTALPTIVADLGGLDRISWAVTAYLLASTVSAPVCGKLGDLFGRKIVIQAGILVFLAGSVVSGVAQNMGTIIAGRLIQGLGGGGLIVVSMAVVADVLPARSRGRVQGLVGGVFGLSTVLGPLIGGFLVQHLNWHWIFFVNLPLGLLALVVLQIVLKPSGRRSRPKVDYAGAGFLAAMLSSAVLLANLAGTALPWTSAPILLLAATGTGALVGFVLAAARAPEPILPLSLFTNNNFLMMNTVGVMVGAAMFGTITFIPLYLQVVQGISPTASGMFLLPMMGGIMAASLAAGQIMVRTGRYKFLPVFSTCLLAVGMLFLSGLSPDTPLWQIVVYLMITGLGIGPVMSAGVTAIQNAVASSLLGVATASANMFRLIGGAIGTSIFGGIFAAGLQARLAEDLATGRIENLQGLNAQTVAAMSPDLQANVLAAFSGVLQPIFLIAAVLSLVAALAALALRELPLSTLLPHTEPEL